MLSLPECVATLVPTRARMVQISRGSPTAGAQSYDTEEWGTWIRTRVVDRVSCEWRSPRRRPRDPDTPPERAASAQRCAGLVQRRACSLARRLQRPDRTGIPTDAPAAAGIRSSSD